MPTSGRIWLDEIDTAGFNEDKLAELRLERLGFVFQFHFLLAEFSALDNIMLPIRKLGRLTEREYSVLGLMAEGLSNHAIARRLFLSEGAISKYTTSLFGKLGITDDDHSNRRVLAVLTYLNKPSR